MSLVFRITKTFVERSFTWFFIAVLVFSIKNETSFTLPQQVKTVRKCDRYAGATADAKISACIADLPVTGGVADARGIRGAQKVLRDPFEGVTKPVTLLIGCVTFESSVIIRLPSGTNIIGTGPCSVVSFIDDGSPTSRQLYINGATDVTVQRLTITSTALSRTAVYGLIRIEGSSRVSILDNTLLTSPSTSVHVINSTDLLIARNTAIGPYADGIHISRGSKRVLIIRNTITKPADDGIGLISYTGNDAAYGDNEDIFVAGNDISGVTVGRGIAVYGGRNIIVSHNSIADVDQAGILVGAIGGDVSNDTTHFPKQITLSNNVIYSAGRNFHGGGTGAGIYVNPARQVSITENLVLGSGSDGIALAGVVRDVVISGNIISRSIGNGISVNLNSNNDPRLIAELFTDVADRTSPVAGKIEILSNHVRSAKAEAVFATMTAPNYVEELTVNSNEIENCGPNSPLSLVRVQRSVIKGNHILNCSTGMHLVMTEGIVTEGNDSMGTPAATLHTVPPPEMSANKTIELARRTAREMRTLQERYWRAFDGALSGYVRASQSTKESDKGGLFKNSVDGMIRLGQEKERKFRTTLLNQAVEIKHELLLHLHTDKEATEGPQTIAFDGLFSGTKPLSEAANYLETLSKRIAR